VTDVQTYDAFFATFNFPNFTYKDSLSNETPQEIAIHLHNEMGQTPVYPDKQTTEKLEKVGIKYTTVM
jgi:hypothetical protein